MNFSLYIAKRYLISKSKSSAINIITWIASIGLVVSTMALFIVLSGFSGLREFGLTFTNAVQPDLEIKPIKGKSFFVSNDQLSQLNTISGISTTSQIVEERALLFYNNKEIIATLKGVDSNYTHIAGIKDHIYTGQWLSQDSPEAVIGYGIAHQLSVGLFDYTNVFQIYMPKAGKGAINNPDQAFTKQNVIPSGIYSVNEDIDKKYIYTSKKIAQQLLQFDTNQISALEVKMNTGADEEYIREQTQKLFKSTVNIKNKIELNDALHKMLNNEHLAAYLIFTLVIIITLFNLIGSIIMMILEKKKNLITLYNMGLTVKSLRQIFLFQGVLLSLSSGLLGLFLGVIIIASQQHYQFVMITDSMAYPVLLEGSNILIVFLTISILGFIASKIASTVVRKKILE